MIRFRISLLHRQLSDMWRGAMKTGWEWAQMLENTPRRILQLIKWSIRTKSWPAFIINKLDVSNASDCSQQTMLLKPKNIKLIIIGKVPPPIGGVTIHVKRLKESLVHEKYPFEFRGLTKTNILWSLLGCLFRSSIIHLHTSSPLLRMIFSIFGKLNGFQLLIITYHGNIGRFKPYKNWLDQVSLKLSDIPIVLNDQSLKIAKSINNNTLLISAFIPPVNPEPLSTEIEKSLTKLKRSKQLIFCTNAYNLSYDKHNNEIYNGTFLIKMFCKDENQKFGFVFSDPSGNYKKHFEKQGLSLTPNILLISEAHSFFEVLRKTDCFIRCTTTDGDPLSVKEALYLQKTVFATDVISRPQEVFTFRLNLKAEELQKLINKTEELQNTVKSQQISNGANELLDLYKEVSQS